MVFLKENKIVALMTLMLSVLFFACQVNRLSGNRGGADRIESDTIVYCDFEDSSRYVDADRKHFDYLTSTYELRQLPGLMFRAYPSKSHGVPFNYMGYQEPHSGDAYVYIMMRDYFSYQRSIIALPLEQNLQKDSLYLISFFVSQADSMKACDGFFNIAFSSEPENTLNTRKACKSLITKLSIENTEQLCDKENWIKVEFTYKAFGDEKYLYIGNFSSTRFISNNQNINVWYYLDDILMIKKP